MNIFHFCNFLKRCVKENSMILVLSIILSLWSCDQTIPVARAAAISIPVAVVLGRLSCSARSRASSLEAWSRASSASVSSASLFPPRGSTGRVGPPSQPTTRVPAVSKPNHSSSKKLVLKKSTTENIMIKFRSPYRPDCEGLTICRTE